MREWRNEGKKNRGRRKRERKDGRKIGDGGRKGRREKIKKEGKKRKTFSSLYHCVQPELYPAGLGANTEGLSQLYSPHTRVKGASYPLVPKSHCLRAVLGVGTPSPVLLTCPTSKQRGSGPEKALRC